jgi:crotonobetainyl-CoA:carnitine CoA-transferase CaiB-like acyl-CoA transferase
VPAGGPLAGVRDVDLTRLLPGAIATPLLPDLGADVVKVEQPGGGDPMRAYEPRIGDASAFTWVSDRNKRSIAVNLRDPRGRDVVLDLAREADVLVESFRPGVADRLGLGWDPARAANPRLVYCSITGYGAGGPLAAVPGHDLNYVGRAGLLSHTGVDGRPAIPGVQIGDLAGGSLLGVAGILAALLHARESGEGDHVDVAMTDGAFALQAVTLGAFFADGRPPAAGTELLNGGFPCYAVYECADGRHITVGALERQFWDALCEAVDRPDLLPTQMDPGALGTWRELFASRPRDAWLEAFEGRDVCVGPLNDLAEAVRDPQLRHREMVVELEHPDAGPTAQLGTPIKLREHPGGVRTPAPPLGGSTRTVLEALGRTAEEIEELARAGVVEGAGLAGATTREEAR